MRRASRFLLHGRGASVGLHRQERTRMSDLSVGSPTSNTPEFGKDEQPSGSVWLAIRKAVSRLSDWFVIQTVAVKLLVIGMALMIPATGIYSLVLVQRQAAVAEQVRGMSNQGVAAFDEKLPVVFGSGSVLSFLQTAPVERITVIYKPLMWNVSE